MIDTTAWILRAGPRGTRGELELTKLALPDLQGEEVLVEPLFGSWEGNMSHALAREPICVASSRNEPYVLLGNAGVVRVLACGPDAHGFAEGEICAFVAFGRMDDRGYLETVHGYDAPGTYGLLAKRTKVTARTLVKLAAPTKHRLEQWAAFSLKYVTAYSNWRAAYGAFRALNTKEEEPVPRVWAWGGGTSLAELALARHDGCAVTYISGSSGRLAEARALGIDVVDRAPFAALTGKGSEEERGEAEKKFLELVAERTGGHGVSIFLDYLGGPVWRATQRALARHGVIGTAGWRLGMQTEVRRAVECIRRHTHVYTHGVSRREAEEATRFAEAHGWLPLVPTHVTPWEEIPSLARAHGDGSFPGHFPVFAISG